MRILIWLLLIPLMAAGQDKKVVVYGQMYTDYKHAKIDTVVGIYVRYTTDDNSYLTFPNKIRKDGHYTRTLEGANTVTIESNVHDFYAPAVTVAINGKDSIRIDLKLVPKQYTYTAAAAEKDLANNKVQLITYDTLEYTWSRKVDLKKSFGFDYLLIQEPDDSDFSDNISDYNDAVEAYLSRKNENWGVQLSIVRDSMINLEADSYGAKHTIRFMKLKVPEKNTLPKLMREKINMWQSNYEHWHKDELDKYDSEQTLKIITKDKQYSKYSLMTVRVSIEYQKLIPELIKLITNKTEVGMEGFDGIMPCRGLAPTEFQPCVAISFAADDLFTVAGRANHILKLLTWENFGNIEPQPSTASLKKLQNRWAYWLLQLQPKP